MYEWALTDTFDANLPEHSSIRLGIERGNGIPTLQTKSYARTAMKDAGFQLLLTEDLAEGPDDLPWWYPIGGVDLNRAQGLRDWMLVIRNTKYGRVAVRFLVRVVELLRPCSVTWLTLAQLS